MYQDPIKSELNEAAEVLNTSSWVTTIILLNWSGGKIDCWFHSNKKVKYFLVVTVAHTVMQCISQKQLTGRYRENRPGYAGIAISDPSHLSCVSNDFATITYFLVM